jgi:MraZ protein
MGFQGEFPHTLDSKNRVVLPAAFRRGIPESEARQVVLSIGRRSRWWNLFTKADWEKRVEQLYQKYDEDDEEDEKFLRDVLGSAFEVELDAQFRFVLPEARRKQVGIDKDVVFVGMGKRIEIWPREGYEVYKAEREGKQEPPAGARG